MAKIHFKRTILKTIIPLVTPLGYQFNEAAQLKGDDLFFEKPSPYEEGVKLFISFQLGHHYIPPYRRFTVNLSKSKGNYSKPDPNYSKTMTCRLGILLRTYYKLEIYPSGDYWWEFTNDEELKLQLEDAVEKCIKYGIPWLEDPNAVPPWEFIKRF